jgi:phenylacetic acid degradation operon negative regulatory protein
MNPGQPSPRHLAITPRAVLTNCFGAAGQTPLDVVYDAAAVLGISDQPLRLAIRRLVSAGMIEQIGRGRRGQLRLTDQALKRDLLDNEYWNFATRQDHGEQRWDRQWRLIAFSIPETRRADRDALRAALTRLSAAALTPGLFVSPHDLTTALQAELSPRNLDDLTLATATSLTYHGTTIERLTTQLWPLDTLSTRYDTLDRVITHEEGNLGDDAEPARRLAARIAILTALTAALLPDPLLPPELLPTDWPGPAARERIRQLEPQLT